MIVNTMRTTRTPSPALSTTLSLVVDKNNVVARDWIVRTVGTTSPTGLAHSRVKFAGGGLALQFGSPKYLISRRIHSRLLCTDRGRPLISILHHKHVCASLSPISSLTSVDEIVVWL